MVDTAFLAGAMVPDFESFLQLRNAEKFGHTTAGIFLLDLPLALLLGIVFHTLVKRSLITYLPSGWRSRFQQESESPWLNTMLQKPWLVVFSALLGIGSHLLWDAFTHTGGFFVTLFPILSYNIKSLDYKPVFFLIQVISSVWGCWYVIYRIQKRKPIRLVNMPLHKILRFWFSLFLLAAFILFLRFELSPAKMSNADWVKAVMGAAVYALLCISSWYTLISRHKKRTATSGPFSI